MERERKKKETFQGDMKRKSDIKRRTEKKATKGKEE